MLLDIPHFRLWRLDGQVATVLFNNNATDIQNGRQVPRLGSFPGELSRSKKVLVQNAPKSDARFNSWQYVEMQKGTSEELGVIVGVGLVDAENQCPLVLEAYGPEAVHVDGAAAFLLRGPLGKRPG